MTPLNWLRSWIRSMFHRTQLEREMEMELRSHMAAHADDLVRGGLTLEEARRRARIEFGGIEGVKEDCRAARGGQLVESISQDLRYALRSLAHSPAFTVVAVLTLALGIGATTAIFSVINDTLLKPLPFPDSGRLVLVFETFGNGPGNLNIGSAPNFWDFRQQSRSFSSMAILDSVGRGYDLGADDKSQAERVPGLRVSAGFFKVLGIQPMLGRTFLPEEEYLGRAREVVLSYGLWKSHYNADPGLLGRSIRIDGEDFAVIGIMPPQFEWQFEGAQRELWVPVGYTKTDYVRDENSFVTIARLNPGTSLETAQAEMGTVAKNVATRYPKEDAGMGATVQPLAGFGMQGLRNTMLTLLAAVGFVLLIACVNVANLLLARGVERRKEFAIRLALGAAGRRIARQLFTENLLLALAGGLAGLAIAAGATRVIINASGLSTMNLPEGHTNFLLMDGRVLGFALVVACLTGLLFGVGPALAALRIDLNDPLKEGGRSGSTSGHNRLRHLLVASEVALALIVLSGAGLMIKSMSRLLGVDPGLNPKNVLTLGLSVPQEAIYVGPPGLPRFCQDLDEYVGAVPGILSTSAVAHLPFEGNAGRSFQIEGRPASDPSQMPGASYTVACPNYFRTMGIPVLRGREFTDRDTLTASQVIVINQKMANDYWPGENPVGKAIRLGGSDGPLLTIVGVVGDVHFLGLAIPARRQFFRPYTQAGWPTMNVVVRSAGKPEAFTAPVKKSLAAVLPDSPVSNAETMEEVMHDSTGSYRLPMLLLTAFSALALVLAAVGIVGVVGHAVAQRTKEIGIRMALGAGTLDVQRLVISGSMIWITVGLAAGLVGSVGLTQLLAGILYDVRPLDPAVLAAVSLLMAAVGLGASYFPARRAAKVDPILALHCE